MHGQRLWQPYPREQSRSNANADRLVHAWNDNPGDITRAVADEYLAFVTVIPQVTGKFRIIGTAALEFNGVVPPGGTSEAFVLKIGHGVGAVADYAQATPAAIFAPGAAVGGTKVPSGTASIQFETAAFPVGTPVVLGLILAGGNGNVTCFAHSAQVTVQELPN